MGNKKHNVSTFDQCFHTKDLKFQYFWLTPLTIPMVKDNREKTSRLIGLANVLPMIGSPLEISTKSTQIYCFETWDAWFASGTRNVTLFVLTRSCQQKVASRKKKGKEEKGGKKEKKERKEGNETKKEGKKKNRKKERVTAPICSHFVQGQTLGVGGAPKIISERTLIEQK